MQGNKTHDQQIKILERKDGLAKARDRDEALYQHAQEAAASGEPAADDHVRPFPNTTGTNRESRDHNKHNDPGQDGHSRQKHGPAEEKT